MKALVNRGPHNFVVEDRPQPRPGSGELLLRPLYAGVCVSDKHIFEGRRWGPEWMEGLVLGHEFDAVVHEAPADLDGFKAGDRVAVDPRLYCHQCSNCRGGLPTLCESEPRWLGVADGLDGGFADLCVAPAYACYPLPKAVADDAGATVEPLACATRCVRLSRFAPGDNVVIIGAEDYGLFVLAQLAGSAGTVVVVDPSEVRRRAARELGAETAIDPCRGTVVRQIRSKMPRGADVVFVSMEDYVSAADDYLRLAFRLARIQGTVCVVRAYGAAPYARIEPQVPFIKEITVRHFGSFFGNEPIRGGRARGDWQVSLDALATGRVAALPESLIVDFEDLRSPRDIAELMASLPDQSAKTLVRIGADAG
jgi:(R,R)-butanediol dehydrogenase / meso-butanediol dehydrogenase / diacetyl reductase